MTLKKILHALRRVVVFLGLTAAQGCQKEPEKKSDLVVFAASSLKAPFEELVRDFERQNPTARVQLHVAGSQVLRLQIEEGAAVDVFASADERHMNALVSAGLMVESRPLAKSDLVIITPLGERAVRRFEDLNKARRIVLGREEVPVGRYAREVLARSAEAYGAEFEAEVLRHVVSNEGNVRLVQAKVELGEADAAFVYRTEAIRSDRVRIVEIPAKQNVLAEYQISHRPTSLNVSQARDFIQYVLNESGRSVFSREGFRAEASR